MPSENTAPTGTKRGYDQDEIPESIDNSPPPTSAASVSAFRNVSACNRCRVRKNRCDQRLPSCSACEKANVPCVGYDALTKREIPRSYVFYLENRLSYLEGLLATNRIPFKPSEAFDPDAKLGSSTQSPSNSAQQNAGAGSLSRGLSHEEGGGAGPVKQDEDDEKLEKLVSNIGMVSVQGTSEKRYLGSTSGISFARVVLAAIKSSVSTNVSDRGGVRPSRPTAGLSAATPSSMRDTYFGLQTKPSIREAKFPDRTLGNKLVKLYFENANPQIPILHRGDFNNMFERAYSVLPEQRNAKELYFLNIVFAIGAGIILGSSDVVPVTSHDIEHGRKRPRLASQQAQPEEYHASAIMHLGAILSGSPTTESVDNLGGELEELQAVLLLAAFALLRPVAPGLWYIVGVAVRLAVDLGLHYEDGADPEDSSDVSQKGRREYVRDLRRRLWWSTYSFDRLVSSCTGRPFGISDQVITTEFPSSLDDKYITISGLLQPPSRSQPSYKRVAYHYFRLRLLQSEILEVLQYQQAQQARRHGSNRDNDYIHTKLQSPFLSLFDSFRSWRKDVDQRLWDWKESAPSQQETGVGFSLLFLELNYWQAVIMLYRQSLIVPPELAEQPSPTAEITSPGATQLEDAEDNHVVFLKSAEAGQKTLKLYRQLHRLHLINFTYLATHHLFMAGISFLYAVWHSPAVRARLALDDFDFTVLAATSVLSDLIEKCPPAESCRDAFERMSKATVQMCMSTPGFAFSTELEDARYSSKRGASNFDRHIKEEIPAIPEFRRRPPPQFDMNLRDLFSDDLDTVVRPSQSVARPLARTDVTHMSTDVQNTNELPKYVPTSMSKLQALPNADISSDDMSTQGPTNSYFPGQDVPMTYNDQLAAFPDMGFLNFSSSNMDDANPDTSALDIGYGMGLDYDHDWNDGQQIDLFDGFFFGNGNNAY